MSASFSMLGHAQSSPIVSGRDALVAVDEHRELLTVDPAVAVTHQLDGHGVDPRVTRVLARRERGQLPVVGAGQMLADVPDLRRHQVEVVEQPFRRGGDELSGPDIVGQRSVRARAGRGRCRRTGERCCGRGAAGSGRS